MSKRGILLIAAGHPYYGNYAVQLARSIQVVDHSMPVAVATCEAALSHNSDHHLSIFSHRIEIPKEYVYTSGVKDYLKAKVHLYDLSPFDETIFIDSDVIWTPNKKASDLFEILKSENFTMANRGCDTISKAHDGFIHWAKPREIMEAYSISGDSKIYNLSSEFIYFRKCKEVRKLFDLAKKVWTDGKLSFKRFSHSMPDELAFTVATSKLGIYPHSCPFLPFYWEPFEKKKLHVKDIYENYYGYSCGGNITERSAKDIYNALANHYNKSYGVRGYFPMHDKRTFLPERTSI